MSDGLAITRRRQMAYTFTASPAYTVRPGTMIVREGIVFSSVFYNCRTCGLLLYHLPDLEMVCIPLTDEYRYGSLYSVRISDLNPSEWGYRYYRDDLTFCDPYARELIRTKKDGKELVLSRPFPYEEDSLPAYGSTRHRDWSKRVLYCMHVQGFTASKTAHVKAAGTFQGVTEKIPYLKRLGVNGVELLPIYELRDNREESYWNFGEGCYFAPKSAYAYSDTPQIEFKSMVDALHAADIEVFLQLFFPDTVTIQTQLETARFYVTHYGIDGFHLKGSAAALQTIASDPMLSDTAIFYYDFPYAELQQKDKENPCTGKPSVQHLCEYTDHFQTLVRRFVKSDNQVLREFIKEFIAVPSGHGRVHYVTNYEGFTLADLVSYNWKHNEANGENNRDGSDNNWSWNCGIEGPSQKKDIRELRNRQLRNFMALNLLAQGTPLLLAGDERCNSQGGNNNPYNQNNETGWVSWRETAGSKALFHFTQHLLKFRQEHAVFRRPLPFTFNDPAAIGYPDVSFHGKEAWKPDLSGYSHTAGILLPEHYASENPSDDFLYVALNMHWHAQTLALPKLPSGYRWKLVMDTARETPFSEIPERIKDQRLINVGGRCVQILQARREGPPRAFVGIQMKDVSAE